MLQAHLRLSQAVLASVMPLVAPSGQSASPASSSHAADVPPEMQPNLTALANVCADLLES